MGLAADGERSSAHEVKKSLGEFCPVRGEKQDFSRVNMRGPTGQNHGAKSRQAGRVVEKNGGGEGGVAFFRRLPKPVVS